MWVNKYKQGAMHRLLIKAKNEHFSQDKTMQTNIDQLIQAENISQIIYQTDKFNDYTEAELIQKIARLEKEVINTKYKFSVKNPFLFMLILVCIMIITVAYELTSEALNSHSIPMCLFYFSYSLYLLIAVVKNWIRKINHISEQNNQQLQYYKELLRDKQIKKGD